jgi:hypothetical protein
MATLAHITVSELQEFIQTKKINNKTRLTVIFENDDTTSSVKKMIANQAIKKLKGSGNGNLVSTLLKDRIRDKEL